jgi:Uma2 family endonuclease
VRIPDVSIYAGPEPAESVPTQPALVVIEVVSDDRHSNLMQKLREYSEWGVRNIWLVDPERRTLHVYANGSLTEVTALTISEYDVQLTGAEIFG